MLETEETVDNLANQFVKFALIHWRDTVQQVADRLEVEAESQPSPQVIRGVKETTKALSELNEFLRAPVFGSVRSLTSPPFNNPVLMQREGYREIFKAFLQFDLAASLAWSGGDDVYAAGQRDVAVLYEYWVFIQLVSLVTSLSGNPVNLESLFSQDENGLSVALQRGQNTGINGEIERNGRKISFELWFNKTFSRASNGSWTDTMRPDCSIRFSTNHPIKDSELEVWLHFDAKYRIDHYKEIFEREASGEQPEAVPPAPGRHNEGASSHRRDDLLKMHAYRDAIRKSGGSYILYPGDLNHYRKEFHELIPGVGAFSLRPSSAGIAEGQSLLQTFLNEVIGQLSDQGSQYERSRFWETKSFGNLPRAGSAMLPATFLNVPPVDTQVLLAFVKSEDHWRWIEQFALYNLRGDMERRGSVGVGSAELSSAIVVLYGGGRPFASVCAPAGGVVLLSKQDLLDSGYPDPHGKSYFGIRLQWINSTEWKARVRAEDVAKLIANSNTNSVRGAPFVTNWTQFVKSAERLR